MRCFPLKAKMGDIYLDPKTALKKNEPSLAKCSAPKMFQTQKLGCKRTPLQKAFDLVVGSMKNQLDFNQLKLKSKDPLPNVNQTSLLPRETQCQLAKPDASNNMEP